MTADAVGIRAVGIGEDPSYDDDLRQRHDVMDRRVFRIGRRQGLAEEDVEDLFGAFRFLFVGVSG